MSDIFDLRPWLEDWPYDPEEDTRIVKGQDGREVLQVRLPLGIEQYELAGRPDGQEPYGEDSVLDYHLGRLAAARAVGEESDFHLTTDECAELFSEGTLYYFRYLHLFQLKAWAPTLKDTTRNLRLFDFVRRYAEEEEDQWYLEKWRPYLIRMHGIAAAMQALEAGHHDRSLALLRTSIKRIEALEEFDEETFQYERQRSLAALREVAEQVHRRRPLTKLERLEKQLERAIETQAFEKAAQLRDKIRAVKGRSSSAS